MLIPEQYLPNYGEDDYSWNEMFRFLMNTLSMTP
jgi:hypothetical protein